MQAAASRPRIGRRRETATVLEQHGSRVVSGERNQGIKGLADSDAVRTYDKPDDGPDLICVLGGVLGKGGWQGRSGRRGGRRLWVWTGFLKGGDGNGGGRGG